MNKRSSLKLLLACTLCYSPLTVTADETRSPREILERSRAAFRAYTSYKLRFEEYYIRYSSYPTVQYETKREGFVEFHFGAYRAETEVSVRNIESNQSSIDNIVAILSDDGISFTHGGDSGTLLSYPKEMTYPDPTPEVFGIIDTAFRDPLRIAQETSCLKSVYDTELRLAKLGNIDWHLLPNPSSDDFVLAASAEQGGKKIELYRLMISSEHFLPMILERLSPMGEVKARQSVTYSSTGDLHPVSVVFENFEKSGSLQFTSTLSVKSWESNPSFDQDEFSAKSLLDGSAESRIITVSQGGDSAISSPAKAEPSARKTMTSRKEAGRSLKQPVVLIILAGLILVVSISIFRRKS